MCQSFEDFSLIHFHDIPNSNFSRFAMTVNPVHRMPQYYCSRNIGVIGMPKEHSKWPHSLCDWLLNLHLWCPDMQSRQPVHWRHSQWSWMELLRERVCKVNKCKCECEMPLHDIGVRVRHLKRGSEMLTIVNDHISYQCTCHININEQVSS